MRLPESVLHDGDQHVSEGVWMTASDPFRAVLMRHPQLGAFMRALLPVRLTGGYDVEYGVWVGVQPGDLAKAVKVWREPEYANLQVSGLLANVIPPWDVLNAPVELAVRSENELPYCVASSHAELHEVLTREWDHDLVLAASRP